MGYATVLNVPRVWNHAQAKAILENTKPIRGTTTVPLGNRRDHHQYSIRANGEDVEMVCYKTPVVTFHSDNFVTIRTDGWCSVSTHQFIQQITGIPAGGRGQYTVLQLKDSKVAISGNESASFIMRDGNWCCVSDNRRPSYRINRKAANNVRLRYKEFTDYIKSFAKLRGEFVEGVYGRDGYMRVTITSEELVNAFGLDADGDIACGNTSALMERTHKHHKQRGEEMVAMITSGDHAQFYKATLYLYGDQHTRYYKPQIHTKVNPPADRGPKNLDMFIMRWHAEEVIEQCETRPNAVPNTAYAKWLQPKRED
jgi:hypothetical protein